MAADPYHHKGWKRARLETLERDNHTCQINGPRCITTATHADHIIPWSEGGAWLDLDNLRASCEPCNTSRGAARMAAMAKLNKQQNPTPSRQW